MALPGLTSSAGAESADDFILPSSGLLPIPAKVVQAIKEGKFVGFRDFLPEAFWDHASKAISSPKDEKRRTGFMSSPLQTRP